MTDVTPQVRTAIVNAVHSFRPGAPITIDDVRFACKVDGSDIDHLDPCTVAAVMRTCAVPELWKDDPHYRRSWIWGCE